MDLRCSFCQIICFIKILFSPLGICAPCTNKCLFFFFLVFSKRYAHDEETADDQEETGWKYIHGDVFRYPKYKSVLAAALGSGTQLFTL